MKFVDIVEESKVFPGEYLLYSPQNKIVVCGAFNRDENFIRAFGNGKYVEDEISKFKKIVEVRVRVDKPSAPVPCACDSFAVEVVQCR